MIVIVSKNYNSTLSGWSTIEYGRFLTDNFNKRKFKKAFREYYNLKGKHIDFVFTD